MQAGRSQTKPCNSGADHTFFGKRINVTVTGDEVEYISTNLTAPIFNDIEVAPIADRIYYGVARSGDLVGEQVIYRLGSEALSTQIREANSSRAGKQGDGEAELPTYLGGLIVEGHMIQTERPPTVTDLNDAVGSEQTVMFNTSTANVPWPNYSGIVRCQSIRTATMQIATSITAGSTVRQAVRHNNQSGGWTTWRPIYTAMPNRPAAPLLWEMVSNGGTGVLERWNGTSWVDATGTPV